MLFVCQGLGHNNFILTFFHFLAKISRFNKVKKLPDAFQQKVVGGFVEEMYVSPDIGFR